MGKLVNKKVIPRREENEVDEEDAGKNISIKPGDIYKNLKKTQNVEDLIYNIPIKKIRLWKYETDHRNEC